MPYCTNCSAQVLGRYCSECGALAESPPMMIDVAQTEIAATRSGGTPVPFTSANKPAGYVRPMGATPGPSLGATDNNRFTARAEELLQSTGEDIAWQGKPSPIILFPPAIA